MRYKENITWPDDAGQDDYLGVLKIKCDYECDYKCDYLCEKIDFLFKCNFFIK